MQRQYWNSESDVHSTETFPYDLDEFEQTDIPLVNLIVK